MKLRSRRRGHVPDDAGDFQPRLSQAQRRNRTVIRYTVGMTVLICAASFALSFVALWDLASATGLPDWITWLFPIFVDGLMLQATISMVHVAGDSGEYGGSHSVSAEKDRKFFRNVLIFGSLVSISGNAYHAYLHAPLTYDPPVAATIAMVAPIALLLSSHGLVILNRRASESLHAPSSSVVADAVPAAVPVVADAVPAAVPVVADAVPAAVPVVADAVPAAVASRSPDELVQGKGKRADRADVVDFSAADLSRSEAQQRVREALRSDPEVSIQDLAVEVGRGSSTVYRWVQQIRQEELDAVGA